MRQISVITTLYSKNRLKISAKVDIFLNFCWSHMDICINFAVLTKIDKQQININYLHLTYEETNSISRRSAVKH